MLAIRLNRTGKRNRAHFRVVVQEHTKAPGKRHVEIVGSYDPHKKTTILKKERILYWISQGAQVSDAVHNMLVREGIIEAKKIAKKMPKPVVSAEGGSASGGKETSEAEAVPEEMKAEGVPVEAEAMSVAEAPVIEEAPVAEIVPTIEEPKAEQVVTDGVFAVKEEK